MSLKKPVRIVGIKSDNHVYFCRRKSPSKHYAIVTPSSFARLQRFLDKRTWWLRDMTKYTGILEYWF